MRGVASRPERAWGSRAARFEATIVSLFCGTPLDRIGARGGPAATHEPGSPGAMSTGLGLRNVMFEVDDIDAVLDRLSPEGYDLVGGVGRYENIWRMAYVRGPEGIIVALTQRIG
jgi:catechol 2,3-dioxygenase-like lactoylglutathione lyase family enzyme